MFTTDLTAGQLDTFDNALARVTLKVDGKTPDRTRIPQRCEALEALPATGLRAVSARLSAITVGWCF